MQVEPSVGEWLRAEFSGCVGSRPVFRHMECRLLRYYRAPARPVVLLWVAERTGEHVGDFAYIPSLVRGAYCARLDRGNRRDVDSDSYSLPPYDMGHE